MILDDFVMLGTTVAEPMSDGRVAVCSAGYSPELRKLVRIYPLGMADAPHRWSQNRIELERNNRDSRDESWTIKGDRHRRDINQKFECIEKHVSAPTLAPQLNKHLVGSTHEADERRLSLALLRPQNARIVWRSNEAHHDHEQGDLFPGLSNDPEFGHAAFPHLPSIEFDDDSTKQGFRRLPLRERGCFEYLRKHPDQWRDLNPHLTKESTLFVGNMANACGVPYVSTMVGRAGSSSRF